MEIIGDEALDEAFEKGVDTSYIELGLLLLLLVLIATLLIPRSHLFQFVAKVLD